MQAIQITAPGTPDKMFIGDYPTPKPAPNEILIKVAATALNRADTLQRAGKYPVPLGDSPLMGLEIAGTVEAVGSEVTQWQKGERICGLVNGGGYAEYCVIHEDMALSIPKGMDFAEAAAIPEVFLTALQALKWLGRLAASEKVLIHAGASGVGTAAIQLAKLLNASEIYATASAKKHQICYDLGADVVIDYRKENFAEVIAEKTAGKGVDVIIDFVAASYFKQNLQSLGVEGRLVMLAFLGGVQVENVNLVPFLMKRI
ncbi:MAG: NAD(P)H-quinone oxidoreductase, partial [Saprospiraceae bacterium]